MTRKFTIAKKGNWIRERRRNPKLFDHRSFRTKSSGSHELILGCPRGKYNPSTDFCEVSTVLQSILHPKTEYYKLCKKGNCPTKNVMR